MERMKIGEVARLAEVSIETIRFYEREGLIAEPPHNGRGSISELIIEDMIANQRRY